MMHFLGRTGLAFNQVKMPLLLLKGAALNLTIYHQPQQRAMGDLDLLIRPRDIGRACRLLERLGCLRGEPLVREDFFPRFHYETEYAAGSVHPVRIDLHVRPFRTLRYARCIPEDAFWAGAHTVQLGRATFSIPSNEDMLIHLATHAAIHGFPREDWLEDIKRWADVHCDQIDWNLFLTHTRDWKLALPVREAIERTQRTHARVCPPAVVRDLGRIRVNWRDRLALRHAPRDFDHQVAHVFVNTLTTPDLSFVLAYLLAVLIPSRTHMADWYSGRHRGWLACAYLLRFLWPIVKHLPQKWPRLSKIETRGSTAHGVGVFATEDIQTGELIARHASKPVTHNSVYVGWLEKNGKQKQRYEITGKLRFLNHSCRASAVLQKRDLVALRAIREGQEITINYGKSTCRCGWTSNSSKGTA